MTGGEEGGRDFEGSNAGAKGLEKVLKSNGDRTTRFVVAENRIIMGVTAARKLKFNLKTLA